MGILTLLFITVIVGCGLSIWFLINEEIKLFIMSLLLVIISIMCVYFGYSTKEQEFDNNNWSTLAQTTENGTDKLNVIIKDKIYKCDIINYSLTEQKLEQSFMFGELVSTKITIKVIKGE